MSKTVKIIICVTVCLLVGFASSFATQSSISTWFVTLEKPVFNPPNYLFGPVWTTLYICMGIAAGLVWDQINVQTELVKKGLIFFIIQLILNGLWSILFFGMQNPFVAMLEMIVLWLMIYETYSVFKKINPISGYLFIPYILWVSFAFALNTSIWWLNR